MSKPRRILKERPVLAAVLTLVVASVWLSVPFALYDHYKSGETITFDDYSNGLRLVGGIVINLLTIAAWLLTPLPRPGSRYYAMVFGCRLAACGWLSGTLVGTLFGWGQSYSVEVSLATFTAGVVLVVVFVVPLVVMNLFVGPWRRVRSLKE